MPICPKNPAECSSPSFGFTSLVYLSVCAPHSGCLVALSPCLGRGPYQSLIYTALTHLQFSDLCRLGQKSDWVPPGVVYCPTLLAPCLGLSSVSPRGNDTQNLLAGTSQSTMHGLGPGTGFPPSLSISGRPCWVQALAWAWGRGLPLSGRSWQAAWRAL